MDSQFLNSIFELHQSAENYPSKKSVSTLLKRILYILYPELSKIKFRSKEKLVRYIDKTKVKFKDIVELQKSNSLDGQELCVAFFDKIPSIKSALDKDVEAILMGDPAAKSRAEVVLAYPGFLATAAYRIAHELYLLKLNDIARIITEYAHSKTGIDIHPGAEIGEYFCIDHGTGVVIGETCNIGHFVKIYQGVTLGALSVKKEDANHKRHPTIEDHVVIYANASILGGETVVGHHSIVGGNVWLTRSIAPESKIYYKIKVHDQNNDTLDTIILKSTEL